MLRSNWGHYVILGVAALLITALSGLLANGNPKVILVVLTIFILIFWAGTFILKPQLDRVKNKQEMMKDVQVKIPGDPEGIENLYQNSLFYCNDLIDFYNGARYRMRMYYILSTLSIAILTGLTPILVLLGESELVTGQWFTWVTIIIPGLASIVASVSTVFHFQEEWVQSKTTAESLEAILQEYRVGVPDMFEINATTEPEKTLERKRALEKLIVLVNQIHLKQMESWASLQRKDNQTRSVDSTSQSNGDSGAAGTSDGDRTASSGQSRSSSQASPSSASSRWGQTPGSPRTSTQEDVEDIGEMASDDMPSFKDLDPGGS